MWMSEEQFADIHIIRQDWARALNKYEADPTEQNKADMLEVKARRARAIRMVHEEDNESVRHLASMFRCTKSVIREALSEETE